MSLSAREYQRRYAALRRAMQEGGFDCLLVVGAGDDFNRGNIRYLTGSGRGGVCVLGPKGRPVFLTTPNQGRNPKLARTVGALHELELRETADATATALHEVSERRAGGKVGLVGKACISVAMYLALQHHLGDVIVEADGIFEALREVKSEEELGKTRQAARVADAVYAMLRQTIKPGLGEFEIYASVKKMAYEMGCEYSFDLIDAAGSGMNMSFYPTIDKLEAGGTLFMEITPCYEGYYCQLPVTLPVTAYKPNVRKMVEAWHAADEAGYHILRPGLKVSDLHNVLIEAVRAHGFNSPYRPGHSLGLDALDFWSITADNHRELKAGMVLAMHPSVLGEFGGDGCGMGYTYLITATGAERFSQVDIAADLLG